MYGKIKLSITFIVILGWATVAYAFSSAPPTSRTGAPGEATCLECHKGADLNAGGGSITIAGLPKNYEAGKRYNVSITIAQSGRQRWGFQATMLNSAGISSGSLIAADTKSTQIVNGNVEGQARSYIEHTSDGTQNGTKDSATFKFDWTAPSKEDGKLSLFVVAIAANGNGANSGDNVYTKSVQISPDAPATEDLKLVALTPNRGPVTGGTTVTLTGTGFVEGITSTFDGIQATVTFVDSKTIKVVTPPNSKVGPVDVAVKNPNGKASSLDKIFTYEVVAPAPTISSIDLVTGPTSGGTDVTILGTNFVQGLTVLFGTKEASVVSVSATEIKVKTAPQAPGKVSVTVKNADGQEAILKDAFTFEGETPATSVQIVAPNGGEVLSAGGLSYTISWKITTSNEKATLKLELSTDGGLTFSKTLVEGPVPPKTTFDFDIPADVKTDKARVRATVVDGDKNIVDVSDKDFSILTAPIITSLSPKKANVSDKGLDVKVNGKRFDQKAVVEVNGKQIDLTKFKSKKLLVAKKVDISKAGTLQIRVHNSDGTISKEVIFTVK